MNFKEKVFFNREIMSMPRGVKEKCLYNKPHSHFSTISIGVVILLSYKNTKGEWNGKSAIDLSRVNKPNSHI